jgi:hypothetical protein
MSSPAEWMVVTDWSANGRDVTGGVTELSIAGEPGRFVFQRYVLAPGGRAWIDVFGGRKDHETLRSFRPGRVKTVHRKTKTRRLSCPPS